MGDERTYYHKLPADGMSSEEETLRARLFEFLGGGPRTVEDVQQDRLIAAALHRVVPGEARIDHWVKYRAAKDFRCLQSEDDGGEMTLKIKDWQQEVEAFLGTLPDGEFSPEENDMREGLLAFLDEWTGDEPPTLNKACGTPEMKAKRKALLG